MKTFKKPTSDEIKKKLSPMQCQVTQEGATEKPFQNEFWDNKRPGIYVDVVSGEPLFASVDKFDSGSGWPSFTRPIEPRNIVEKPDNSHGMKRTEIKSLYGESHLGHLFNDGPAPTGLRYCVNSASLRFVPVDSLEKEGYGEYKNLFMSVGGSMNQAKASKNLLNDKAFLATLPIGDFATDVKPGQGIAVLAAGCFWGVEEIIRGIKGVVKTQVGYIGGTSKNPVYQDVKTGKTGHAEAVQIVFDSSKMTYQELLGWFFRLHDPTTMNRQGNDIGTQYRSTIFVYSDEQRSDAKLVRDKVDASKKWKNPVVTEIVDASAFWVAEDYHQDYLQKNPNGYTCHFLRD